MHKEKIEKLTDFLHTIVRDFSPVCLASSLGAEDMLLTHLIAQERLPITLFTLDTGRLPESTLRLLARIKDYYGLTMKVYFPEREDVELLVAEQGVNGFYDSVAARKACCHVRKVKPLSRALMGQSSWITGLRREQSLIRSHGQLQEWDVDHQLTKFAPLLEWSSSEVWDCIRSWNIPYNALHDQGFTSIGCAPCTRAIHEGDDERSGRWWWEHSETKECGLHLTSTQEGIIV